MSLHYHPVDSFGKLILFEFQKKIRQNCGDPAFTFSQLWKLCADSHLNGLDLSSPYAGKERKKFASELLGAIEDLESKGLVKVHSSSKGIERVEPTDHYKDLQWNIIFTHQH